MKKKKLNFCFLIYFWSKNILFLLIHKKKALVQYNLYWIDLIMHHVCYQDICNLFYARNQAEAPLYVWFHILDLTNNFITFSTKSSSVRRLLLALLTLRCIIRTICYSKPGASCVWTCLQCCLFDAVKMIQTTVVYKNDGHTNSCIKRFVPLIDK